MVSVSTHQSSQGYRVKLKQIMSWEVDRRLQSLGNTHVPIQTFLLKPGAWSRTPGSNRLRIPDGHTSIFTRAQSQTQTDYVLKVWSLLPLRIFMLLTPDGCTNLYKGPPSQTQTDYVLKVWSMWLPWKHSCSHSDPSESYMDIPWGSKRTQNRLCLESSTEDCSPLGIPMSLFRPFCWSLEPEAEHLEAIAYGIANAGINGTEWEAK